MYIQNWVDVVGSSLYQLWTIIVTFLPRLLGSLIVFFVGWAIAVGLGAGVERLIRGAKLDGLLAKLGLGEALHRAGMKLDSGKFLGGVVKWFLIIAFLSAALEVLGLEQASMFLQDKVLGYLPNIVVAVVVLVLGVLVANFLRKTVEASTVHSVGGAASRAIGSVVKWAVLIFVLWPVLEVLGVPTAFLQVVLTGIVAMLAIAGGLAFGLGGRDAAHDVIEKARDRVK